MEIVHTGTISRIPLSGMNDWSLSDCPYWREATPIARLHGLRQQADREKRDACLCISDFVAPTSAGRPDYLGLFAVTAGIGDEIKCKKLVGECVPVWQGFS